MKAWFDLSNSKEDWEIASHILQFFELLPRVNALNTVYQGYEKSVLI